MWLEALPWGLAAGLLLCGGLLRPIERRRRAAGAAPGRRQTGFPGPALPAAALAATLAGLVWRAWRMARWPGGEPADALALLGCGALLLTAWAAGAASWGGRAAAVMPSLGPWDQPQGAGRFAGLVLIVIAGVLAAAAALAAVSPQATAGAAIPLEDWSAAAAGSWLFGLRNVLAGLGLGGWLPAAAMSAAWGLGEVGLRSRRSQAGSGLGEVGPARDPGRAVALRSYPWLTAALLAAAAWQLAAHAVPWRAAPSDLWLAATWLLGAAHLHLTSTWRPLRLPAWLPGLFALGAAFAALLAALTARSLLG